MSTIRAILLLLLLPLVSYQQVCTVATPWEESSSLSTAGASPSPLGTMGYAVGLDGDVMVSGAPNRQSVFVFRLQSDGSWFQEQQLQSVPPVTGIGEKVAIKHGLIVSCSPYMFGSSTGGCTSWSLNATAGLWQNPGNFGATPAVSGGRFGCSVAVSASEDLWVMGSNTASPDTDFVYLFTGTSPALGDWQQLRQVTCSLCTGDDSFGVTVAIAGDLLLVGADLADSGFDLNAGAVYLHQRNQGGTDMWGYVAHSIGDVAGARLGAALSILQDGRAAVGAYFAGSVGGLVQLHSKDEGGINNFGLVRTITSPSPWTTGAGGHFGSGAVLSPNAEFLAVSAPSERADGGVPPVGRVHLFKDPFGSEDPLLEMPINATGVEPGGTYYGQQTALAFDGHRIVVGARTQKVGGVVMGVMHVYDDLCSAPVPLPPTSPTTGLPRWVKVFIAGGVAVVLLGGAAAGVVISRGRSSSPSSFSSSSVRKQQSPDAISQDNAAMLQYGDDMQSHRSMVSGMSLASNQTLASTSSEFQPTF